MQRDVETAGHEGGEDARFDPRDRLMEDRAHFPVALEVRMWNFDSFSGGYSY